MKKFLLGTVLAATVSVGYVTFTGGDIVDQVNAKVEGMFEMIGMYKNNERKLSVKVNDLKMEKLSLQKEVDILTSSNTNKDEEIEQLNAQIASLDTQIKELEAQLEDKNNLAKEITRLENEVTKANSKVSELQNILDRQIEEDSSPMTEKELEDALSDLIFGGTIYITSYESADVWEIKLTEYAKATITKVTSPEDKITFEMRVEPIGNAQFGVIVGNDYGDRGDLCTTENPFIIPIDPTSEYSENYIIIDDLVKYKIEASER